MFNSFAAIVHVVFSWLCLSVSAFFSCRWLTAAQKVIFFSTCCKSFDGKHGIWFFKRVAFLPMQSRHNLKKEKRGGRGREREKEEKEDWGKWSNNLKTKKWHLIKACDVHDMLCLDVQERVLCNTSLQTAMDCHTWHVSNTYCGGDFVFYLPT